MVNCGCKMGYNSFFACKLLVWSADLSLYGKRDVLLLSRRRYRVRLEGCDCFRVDGRV